MTRMMSDATQTLSLGQAATLACLLEVAASKPGNVHRGADFEDMTFLDFLLSAVAIAPAIDSAVAGENIGGIVLAGVRATRAAVGKNTNLGTLLLLAPLAKAEAAPKSSSRHDRRLSVSQVLSGLTAQDAQDVYAAIRLAQPGGLGAASQGDVYGDAPDNLIDAMRLAAERDLVARQYAGGFVELFEFVVPALRAGLERGCEVLDAIVHAQMQLMSEFPDSLIGRKCGAAVALESALRAGAVLRAGQPGDEAWHRALGEFDFWLRSDGHRRNPGTTADLLAAGLFVGILEGWTPRYSIQPPPSTRSPS